MRDYNKKYVSVPNKQFLRGRPPFSQLGISLVYAFYNEKNRFDLQIENIHSLNKDLRKSVFLVFVDDGSNPPILSWMPKKLECNLEIYQIHEDIRWNTPGALNLGVVNAPTDWVVTLDSDCLFTPENMTLLLTQFSPGEKRVYFFNTKRVYKDRVEDWRYQPCTFLVKKEDFVHIGGFDEDFVGAKSGGYAVFDRDFEERIVRYGRFRNTINGIYVHEYREDMLGPNIQTKSKMTGNEFEINKGLWYNKLNGVIPRNRKILNFPWTKVFEHRI